MVRQAMTETSIISWSSGPLYSIRILFNLSRVSCTASSSEYETFRFAGTLTDARTLCDMRLMLAFCAEVGLR